MFSVLLRHTPLGSKFNKLRDFPTPLKVPCKHKRRPSFQGTRSKDCPEGRNCLRQTPTLSDDSIMRRQLLHEVFCPSRHTGLKVTVVGSGNTGMATTFSMFQQGVVSRLALVGDDVEVLRGEQMDIMHGSIFLDNRQIVADKDYSITDGSHLCVIMAGMARSPTEDSDVHLVYNLETVARIVPKLLRYSPNAVLLVVSNPVELVTYATWKISGLPPERVIGSGTFLDSMRFQFYLAQRLGVPLHHVNNAWIIGQHGKLGIPVWSAVDVNGIRLRDKDPTIGTQIDKGHWNELYERVACSADRVLKLKGYTSWAISLGVTALVRSLLLTCNLISPICVFATGFHGIKEEVYLSLPCTLCNQGVSNVVRLRLDDIEQNMLLQTSQRLAKKVIDLGL